jgi:hypothetical protein
MDTSKLTGKMVQIKLAGDNHPQSIPIKVEQLDSTGIWLQSASLLGEIIEGDPNFKQAHFGEQPYIFLPLTQLEWMLVPGKAVQ